MRKLSRLPRGYVLSSRSLPSAPRVLEIPIGTAVLSYRPIAIGRWVVSPRISLAVGGLVCTMLLQRPIHDQLGLKGTYPSYCPA